MRIAILGATSQIARDLIISFSETAEHELLLFARRPGAVDEWLAASGLEGRYAVEDFTGFAKKEFDAVINFVGVGNPVQLLAMGNTILFTVGTVAVQVPLALGLALLLNRPDLRGRALFRLGFFSPTIVGSIFVGWTGGSCSGTAASPRVRTTSIAPRALPSPWA